MKNFFINLFLLLLLLVGLALIFNKQIQSFLLSQLLDKNRVENVSRKDIEANMNKKASFDFEAVESADFESVLRGRLNNENMYVVGGIAIPEVNINLPVYKGLSPNAITFGAGTMKEEQRMGEGNYALASHHMIDREILFGPLVHIELGHTIYLTDLAYIYEYTVVFKEYVAPTRVDLIDDVADRVLVTLITCDYTGANRIAVQGELVQKVSVKEASKEMQNAFNLKENLIEGTIVN
ncbi:class A sortase [Vagococcus elongatus]|nr:class A sortase [Vagococcus elongatus]